MKIVVVSDTHGDFSELKRVYIKENDARMFLHAGDSEAFDKNELAPFVSVKGNCDYGLAELQKDYWANTPYGLIYMRHHPITDASELKELKQKRVKIFIHGHTHIKENKKLDDLYILCPGSLTKPRDGQPSYMVLEVTETDVKVEFKTL